ncbi:MAG: hypothetical protein JXA78_15625 [Anaerolineales bacterium]|nr:hypothetical protein [Anaerolineales bacterium]
MGDNGSVQNAGSDKQLYSRLLILGFVTVVLGFLLAAQFSPTPNARFAGDVAVLSIITAGAVAIERILEAFWTYISSSKSSWWPLNEFSRQIQIMENGLDNQLKPVYDQARYLLDEAAKQPGAAMEKITAAKQEIDDLEKNLTWIKDNLTIGDQRVQMVTTRAQQNLAYLQKLYPQVQGAADAASQAIAGVSDLVATFKDNPGRRLMSIVLGCLLGLAVAGLLGLDVFLAAGGATAAEIATDLAGQQANIDLTSTAQAANQLLPHLGVALTGLIMGLGANPAHEIIRVLQEHKKSSKLNNTPMPFSSEGAAMMPMSLPIPGMQAQPWTGDQPLAAPVLDMLADAAAQPAAPPAPAPNVIIVQAPSSGIKTFQLRSK